MKNVWTIILLLVNIYNCSGKESDVQSQKVPETRAEKMAQERARERMMGKQSVKSDIQKNEAGKETKKEVKEVKEKMKEKKNGSQNENLIWLANMTDLDRKKGGKAFKKNGCRACHYKKEGMDLIPYPSKQRLATKGYNNFTDCVLNGRPGTVMVAKKIKEADLQRIYTWLQKYR